MNTGDATFDITFAQTVRNISEISRGLTNGLLPREPGFVANRILRERNFDYVLQSGGPAYLQQGLTPDIYYGRSSGLLGGFPTHIVIDSSNFENVDRNGFTLGGERFDEYLSGQDSIFYRSTTNSNHIIEKISSSFQILYIIPTDFRRDAVTFVGGGVSIFGFGNPALLVPSAAFGNEDVVKTSTLDRQLTLASSLTSGTNRIFLAGGRVAIATPVSRDSYAEYLRYVRYELPGGDPVGVALSASDTFMLGNPSTPEKRIEVSYNTLQSFSGVEGFQFIQLADYRGNLIIHAAGDVSDARSGQFSIDNFSITRGLLDADLVQGETADPSVKSLPGANDTRKFRAFLPPSSMPIGLSTSNLATTPLLIVNPADSTAPINIVSKVFHADLGVTADGTSTTASATLGSVSYQSSALPNPPLLSGSSVDDPGGPEATPRSLVSLTGRTIATSTAPTTAGATPGGGSVLIDSPIVATAVGGARTWRTISGVQLEKPGYAGYFVLENATNVGDSGPAASGGTIDPVGIPSTGTDVDRYGLLRLASGFRTTGERAALTTATRLNGYVAGALTYEASPTSNIVTPYVGSLVLNIDPAINQVSARVSYAAPEIASNAPIRNVRLGEIRPIDNTANEGGQSAYIDPARYGASVSVPDGPKAALVAGEALKSGIAGAPSAVVNGMPVQGAVSGNSIAKYAHVQWGFFFGDLMPQASGRTFTGLSSWVAGDRYTGSNALVGSDSAVRGSVRFGGHAIGTVITQSAGADPNVAVRVGSFNQTWNLTARTGTMDLAFDGQSFAGTPLAIAGSTGLGYSGTSGLVGDRAARITGELVSVPTPTALPGGTIGQFEIRGLTGAYQANGTFAGDRSN